MSGQAHLCHTVSTKEKSHHSQSIAEGHIVEGGDAYDSHCNWRGCSDTSVHSIQGPEDIAGLHSYAVTHPR